MGLQDRPIYRRDFIISYSNRVVHDVIGKFYRMHADMMESVASVLRIIQKVHGVKEMFPVTPWTHLIC